LRSIAIIAVLLFPVIVATTSHAGQNVFGLRLGSGFLWAPQDKEDLDGERLYRHHYPFFGELCYGRRIKGVVGLNHIFSQEAEHTELDSLGEEIQFTPKLRQYLMHLGIQIQQNISPRVLVHTGLGAMVFWRSYNPGWKDKSYWDKARVGAMGQVGLDVKIGPKTLMGAGWRMYAVGRRQENRWTRGEFDRMRRMNVLSLTVSYFP